jgi:hypothetical protein
MDFNILYEYTRQGVRTLGAGWFEKAAAASIGAMLQMHAELMCAFIILIILDLATKWLALAKPLTADGTLAEEICMIPEAHRRGLISSDAMKTRFVSKIMMYMLIAFASGVVDFMFKDMHMPAFFMTVCIGYLATTELLSVVENLNDAGVSALADLADVVKRKRRM